MKILVFIGLAAFSLAACGVDGEPLTPSYEAQTKIGYNSSTGPFNSTKLSVVFGN